MVKPSKTPGKLLPLLLLLAACQEPPPPQTSDSVTLRDTPAPASAETPSLIADANGALVMSWVERVPEGSRLLTATLSDSGWTEPRLIASGEDWFVNWADFPAVAIADGLWAAHWLAKVGDATYAYAVNYAISRDQGASWSSPGILHRDVSATEHGFVSYFADPDSGLGVVWLDGRHTEDGGAMTLRTVTLDEQGGRGDEQELDDRVCDCCQTDATVSAAGPLLVYRDRTEDELRDIALVRRVDGEWTEPVRVARDDWKIGACPVNGPAVASHGDTVAVAWFTGAQGPQVKLAVSEDGGLSFGEPLLIDGSDPLGRVDVAFMPDGRMALSYMDGEQMDAQVRVALVSTDGSFETRDVGSTAPSRSSGFPRISYALGELWIAWREVREDGNALRLAAVDTTRAQEGR